MIRHTGFKVIAFCHKTFCAYVGQPLFCELTLEVVPGRSVIRHTGFTVITFLYKTLCVYIGQPLFRELTLEVVPGRSVMLMGPNGCGKSSLFRVSAVLSKLYLWFVWNCLWCWYDPTRVGRALCSG